MSMHGGPPTDPKVVHLPLSDPRCNSDSCIAFQAAHNASQAAVSYAWQFEYGHWTTWYYIIVIFLFMLIFLHHSLSDRRPWSAQPGRPSVLNKIVASIRCVSYRRYSGPIADKLSLPSVGMQIFFLGAIIFATVATFAVRPYYRDHRGYGSPPLGVRTGLMAIALTPIIVALSGKVNLVTMLTGIGYEKLNVVHRWLSYICLGLSVVHTIPFLVAPYRDGGAKQLHKQFYKPGGLEYTGTPPLAILVFLCTFSIPWIRARFYELFVHSHIWGAIVYLGLMFWHASNLGDSWVYLWATVAIWLFSLLGRIFYKSSFFSIRRSWAEGFPSTLESLPGNMMKLQVLVPTSYGWSPGQHCFLRIPALSMFDNHPFTIASSPNDHSTDEKAEDVKALTFLVRPHKGFTQKLSSFGATNTDISLRAFVDGPYGGLSRKLENAFDNIILVAGGGGITASISWLLHLASCMNSGNVTVSQVRLIWVVRKEVHLQWIQEELNRIVATAPANTISLEFYVTDDVEEKANGQKEMGESAIKRASELSKSITNNSAGTQIFRPQFGRPYLRERILQGLDAPRTCVLGCGPESMKIDLSNAMAEAQRKVIKGDLCDVALYTETFGW